MTVRPWRLAACATALAFSMLLPAWAEDSFVQSCTGIRQKGPILSASCRDGQGRMIASTIDMRICGQMDVANADGVLSCGSNRGETAAVQPPPPAPPPPASIFNPFAPRPAPLDQAAQKCQSYGFAPGSPELAHCIDAALASHDAEQAVAAQRDREERRKREQDDADWRRRVDEQVARDRAAVDAWKNGPGPGQNPAGGLPSAAAIPGMECMGSGNETTCNAR